MAIKSVNFKNFKNKSLVGLLHTVNSKSIIIMAHGFSSDKSSRGRFEKLATAFNNDGYDALRFDFTGCGESDNEIISVITEVNDLNAAIYWIKSLSYQYIGLYGHSFGSFVCLKCYSPEISTIAMSGGLTGPMNYNWEEYFGKEKLHQFQDKNYIIKDWDTGSRSQVLIEKQMLEDIKHIDQQKLLANVKCPVLIIHGDNENDKEELALLEIRKKH